ncbi:hypothetical protein EIN_136000 [Entamoeba invadens IP1]|uniref:AP180 N-terminal homology (ANTH) domain-containing protein n=1 Tax=Entamoeba invadens IP1 TaxID=370355 RepID=A0A0A1U0E3_ENTIV|nr:hypothetical protein EIN_136000 [Entamoeba invadens IP1]ELP85966.1 hypothetical protein EIN_136000 [Entamoeba invadens IP1]|eukprot:XP_004185312.1 hypothetical protein EIN_136000 [Entamoeba invadens IP1]
MAASEETDHLNGLWQTLVDTPGVPSHSVVKEIILLPSTPQDGEKLTDLIVRSLSSSDKKVVLKVLYMVHKMLRSPNFSFENLGLTGLISCLERIRLFWMNYEDSQALSLLVITYSEYVCNRLEMAKSLPNLDRTTLTFKESPPHNEVEKLVTKLFGVLDSFILCIQTLEKNIDFIKLEIITEMLREGKLLYTLCKDLSIEIYKKAEDDEMAMFCVERLKVNFCEMGRLYSEFYMSPFIKALVSEDLGRFPEFEKIEKCKTGRGDVYIDVKWKDVMRNWFEFHRYASDEEIRKVEEKAIQFSVMSEPITPRKSEAMKVKSIEQITKVKTITSELSNMYEGVGKFRKGEERNKTEKALAKQYKRIIGRLIALSECVYEVLKTSDEKCFADSSEDLRKSVELGCLSKMERPLKNGICHLEKIKQKMGEMVNNLYSGKVDWNVISNEVKCINGEAKNVANFVFANFGEENELTQKTDNVVQTVVLLSKDLSVETYSDVLLKRNVSKTTLTINEKQKSAKQEEQSQKNKLGEIKFKGRNV